jgi:hypothetical protein
MTKAARVAALLIGTAFFTACSPTLLLTGLAGATGGVRLETLEVPIVDSSSEREKSVTDTIRRLVQVVNTPPQITVFTPNLEVILDAPVYLGVSDSLRRLYIASDAEDGTPRISLSSSLDGLLPTDEYRFQSLGWRVLTITATDAQGASASATFAVSVRDRPR